MTFLNKFFDFSAVQMRFVSSKAVILTLAMAGIVCGAKCFGHLGYGSKRNDGKWRRIRCHDFDLIKLNPCLLLKHNIFLAIKETKSHRLAVERLPFKIHRKYTRYSSKAIKEFYVSEFTSPLGKLHPINQHRPSYLVECKQVWGGYWLRTNRDRLFF